MTRADPRLLDRLASAGGDAVSVDSLAKALGVSAEGLRTEIDGLRAAGYVVERTYPHASAAYRLLEVPDRVVAEDLEKGLSTRWAGRTTEVHLVLGSTNDRALELARAGAPSGALVVAERQTAGRGRAGRKWHSPPGLGLYVSMVYRPPRALPSPAVLQITAGVAVAHAAMKLTGSPARLRWPNDVLFGDRKVAGILADAIAPGTERAAYVVGIGLNVNHRAEDFDEEIREVATSLAMVREAPFPRRRVLSTLLETIEEWYDRVGRGETEAVADAWRPLSTLLDREVELLRGTRSVSGRIVDLCPVRGVRLKSAGGPAEWLPAEHVSRIRPAGSSEQ